MSAPEIKRRGVVRGTARRVVIVPQSGSGPFEQAIFIVRGDCSVSESELLREAMEAVGAEAKKVKRPRLSTGRSRLYRSLPWIVTGAAALLSAAAVLIF